MGEWANDQAVSGIYQQAIKNPAEPGRGFGVMLGMFFKSVWDHVEDVRRMEKFWDVWRMEKFCCLYEH